MLFLKTSNKYKPSAIFKEFFLVAWIISLTLFIFQPHFQGFMLGESVDTRLFIAQLEHWHRLLQDPKNFRDVYFFYPYDRALGFSDALFLLALPYVGLRILGFSLVVSWSLVTIFTVIIGNIGWQIFSKIIITNFVLRFFFISIVTLSATLVARMERLPTSFAGFTLISFIFILIYKIFYDLNSGNSLIKFLIFLNLFILLALTSWYAAIFSLLHFAIFFMIFVFLSKKRPSFFQNIQESLASLPMRPAIFLISTFTLLTTLWAYIFVPVSQDPIRPWWEVYKNSSNFFGTFLSNNLNNGFSNLLFGSSFNPSLEARDLGLPISLSTLTFVFILYHVFTHRKLMLDNKSEFGIVTLITSAVIFLFFMRLGNEFTMFKIIWENIPGMNSIRSPSRYLVIVFYSFLIFIFIIMDKLYTRNKFLMLLFSFILFLDQIKFSSPRWIGDEYINKDLVRQINFLQQNCDYFVLEIPGGWWNDKAQAIALAQVSGVRSATGGSGGFPVGYPDQRPQDEGDLLGLLAWSNFGLDKTRGCLILDPQKTPIRSYSQRPRIDFREGFSAMEQNEKVSWVWADQNRAIVYASATNDSAQYLNLKFEIGNSPCKDYKEIEIYHDNEFLQLIKLANKNKKIDLRFKNNSHGVNQLTFLTYSNGCSIEGDSRELFYELKNPIVEISK